MPNQHMAARYGGAVIREPDVTLLETNGHYPPIESPEAVLTAYLEFRHRIASNRDA